MKNKSSKYKLVYVEWVDSYGCSAQWETVDSVQHMIMKCISVGWLFYEDEEMIIIIPHLSQHDHKRIEQQGCGDMSIPKSAIKVMNVIKEY